MPRKTGQYQETSVAGETVRAFVPSPLPPLDPPLLLDEETSSLIAQAEQKLVQLDLAGRMVPSLDWFIYAYARKEAVTSSQIEGTQATLIDLLSFEADDTRKKSEEPDIEEVCNYLDAVKYAREQLSDKKGLPLSLRLLNETHKRLMKGVRGGNKRPGDIRQSQNWIGGSRPGNATFVPPPPHLLPELLTDLEKYVHADDTTLPPLVRIGLLHVQFETIHPYLDGNGRIGRLLIALLFEHWSLLKAPLLYLSLYFKRNRDEYYRQLGNVREQGDWEAWTKFFLTGVHQIADEAIQLAGHLSQIMQEDRAKILAGSASTMLALRLFELLPTHPILTASKVVKLLNVSKPTALKAIDTLEDLSILKETTGQKRDRSFEYAAYLGKLKFGTELKMYRVVLDFAHERFSIRNGRVEYIQKAGYEFFFESLEEAEKYYAEVRRKLKGTAVEGAELEYYDSHWNRWVLLQSGVVGKEDGEISGDKLEALRKFMAH